MGAPKDLTVKQERFATAYVETNGNASEAARQAGYSESGASVEGCRTLAKASVQARIATYLGHTKEEQRDKCIEFMASILERANGVNPAPHDVAFGLKVVDIAAKHLKVFEAKGDARSMDMTKLNAVELLEYRRLMAKMEDADD